MAIILAVNFTREKGWHHLWIESDSSAAIAYLSSYSSQPPWSIYNKWKNCLALIRKMQVVFTHSFREGNYEADKVANHALHCPTLSWWSSDPGLVDNEVSTF